MDSGLKSFLLVMGLVIYCCTTPGQTEELIQPVREHFGDYTISGSIYVLHVHEIPDSLTALLRDHIETYGHVIVKLAGHPISIVPDADALHRLLHESVHHHNNVSIAQDLLNVAYISEQNSHLLMVVDEHKAEMTEDTDLALAFLRGSTIRVDVIRLPVTSGARYRRQSSVDFYQLLANLSGGSVITTDKNNIGSAVNIISQSLQTDRVNLMRFSYSAAAGQTFMIFVDDTITHLFIRVQAERAQPFVIAMMPSGTPSSARPTTIGSVSSGSIVTLLEINITQASDYGIWKFFKMDGFLWDVTIQATSPVDFTHKFVEPVSGGFGEYEIKGRPISGVMYKMVVEVPEYAKLSKVQAVLLMTRDSFNPQKIVALLNIGGRRGHSTFYTNITIPDEPFMVAIQGQDNSSPTKHPVRRLDPNLITPVTIRLIIPPLTGVTLWANETLDITFTVQNAGAVDQDIDVRIEDDQDFALEPKVYSFNIQAGMNETGHFTIKGGPKGGVRTTVTINAKPLVLGSTSFQFGQFDILRFTVIEHTTTTTRSTTTTSTSPSSMASSNVFPADLSTLSSLLTGSTKATASGNPGSSTSTALSTHSPADTPNSSSGAHSASSASQSQAISETAKYGGTQSSSGTSTVSSLPQSTKAPAGTPKLGGTQSSSGSSTVSGLPQTGATQAPSGIQNSGASQTTEATIGRWYGRRSSGRCVMTLVETCFPDL